MATRVDVFISSTSLDLPPHRKQAMEACMRMGMFPIMMEHLPASDADAIRVSLEMVDEAEIYVGIFAWRYGYIPAGYQISITEMEYQRAVERNIPRLIFIMHDDHPIEESDVETGIGAEKLEVLKSQVMTEQVVNFFISPEDLRAQLIHSLIPYRMPDIGPLHPRFASDIPLPPEPYIAHPYALLETGKIIGRTAELEALRKWAQSPENPLQFVVAIGGMGKSALTWKWFHDLAPTEIPDLAGRMWWSFYESDAHYENFITRALAYVSQRPREKLETLPLSERETQLLGILDQYPYLIVLDGLERLMVAYARLDAVRLSNGDLDEQTAHFRTEDTPEFQRKRQLRQMTDTRIGVFLRKLTQIRASQIVFSTRLFPVVLEAIYGEPMAGVQVYDLSGLTDGDALALWQSFQVSGSPDALLPMFHSFDNYPLLIRALAGEVAKFRRAPGDFDRWLRANPDFSPATLPIVQVKSHILQFALQGLSVPAKRTLQTIAAFRMPANYDTLVDVLVGTGNLLSHEHLLDEILTDLEDRGLVGWDKRSNRYDLHPVVRGVVWQQIEIDTKQSIYKNLQTYFEAMPVLEHHDVHKLEDLAPSIELFNSLIGLKNYNDALTIFYERLSRQLQYNLSSHGQRAELLEMFFPDGLNALPAVTRKTSKAFVLGNLARSYVYLGRPGDAVELYRKNIEVNGDKKNKVRTVVQGQLSNVYRLIGELYMAEYTAREAILSAIDIEDELWRVDGIKYLGIMQTTCGNPDGATYLDYAMDYFESIGHVPLQSTIITHQVQLKLWTGAYAEALELSEYSTEITSEGNHHHYIRSLRLQGEAHLHLGDLTRAFSTIHEALTEARQVSMVVEEIPCLIDLVEVYRQQGLFEKAYEILNDIWEMVRRGPYHLYFVDTLLVASKLALSEDDLQRATDYAHQAYQRAWADGEPYTYAWGLAQAESLLQILGSYPPDLPVFNSAGLPPLPVIELV